MTCTFDPFCGFAKFIKCYKMICISIIYLTAKKKKKKNVWNNFANKSWMWLNSENFAAWMYTQWYSTENLLLLCVEYKQPNFLLIIAHDYGKACLLHRKSATNNNNGKKWIRKSVFTWTAKTISKYKCCDTLVGYVFLFAQSYTLQDSVTRIPVNVLSHRFFISSLFLVSHDIAPVDHILVLFSAHTNTNTHKSRKM